MLLHSRGWRQRYHSEVAKLLAHHRVSARSRWICSSKQLTATCTQICSPIENSP